MKHGLTLKIFFTITLRERQQFFISLQKHNFSGIVQRIRESMVDKKAHKVAICGYNLWYIRSRIVVCYPIIDQMRAFRVILGKVVVLKMGKLDA